MLMRKRRIYQCFVLNAAHNSNSKKSVLCTAKTAITGKNNIRTPALPNKPKLKISNILSNHRTFSTKKNPSKSVLYATKNSP